MDFEKRCNRWVFWMVVIAVAIPAAILWRFVPEQYQSVQTLWAVSAAIVAFMGILAGGTVEGCRRMDRWLDEDPIRSAPPAVIVAMDRLLATLDRYNEALLRRRNSRF